MLNRMVRGHLGEEAKFEQRLEGGEGVSQMNLRRKNILGRGNSLSKGPKAAGNSIRL